MESNVLQAISAQVELKLKNQSKQPTVEASVHQENIVQQDTPQKESAQVALMISEKVSVYA